MHDLIDLFKDVYDFLRIRKKACTVNYNHYIYGSLFYLLKVQLLLHLYIQFLKFLN